MRQRLSVVCMTASLAILASCSNDPTVNPNTSNANGSNITFLQVDRVGRPGLKELYLPYASHDAFNRAAPSTDVAQTAPLVGTFVTTTARRTPAIAAYVQALLTPDALIANLADANVSASYLGWETNGQIVDDCTLGNGAVSARQAGVSPLLHTFGGRGPSDDVVSAMLSLAFGNLATTAALTNPTPNVVTAVPAADDGAEKNGANGTPNLTNQHVSCAGKGLTLGRFPYLADPI